MKEGMKNIPSLPITSGQGDYRVDFADSLTAMMAEIARLPRAVVLVDRNIVRLYSEALGPVLSTHPALEIDATEDEKTPDGVLRALAFFQRTDTVKQTTVVAIGGGIIQDIATFAAHVYYRGVRWFYVPTTLLGMADSCIGAKCGINFGPFKNQLGVFHSPAHVWICLAFLDTLTDTELSSGYGEILKLHLTSSGPELFAELKETVTREGWRNAKLAKFIRRSLEVKKGVIEVDEYELHLRRILNYGHTFGHALESVTHHAIPHGLAVAWGIDLVNFLAWRSGMVREEDFLNVHEFVLSHFSWQLPSPVDARVLIDATRRDKKVVDGRLNLVLPDRLGSLKVVSRAYDCELEDAVGTYLDRWNALRWS
ncbi:MAG: 3-dehydroquinate synthase [Phycisphaerae bacterium]|nr:3-dehydroquinate synthase [Phycisphaerae bacterium]